MPKGIYPHKKKHGLYNSRFYRIWRGIRSRTRYNQRQYDYKLRGIKNEWKTFIEFRDDMYESYLKHCNQFGIKNTSIDRINNNGDYCKENCRWATPREQANNTRRNVNITFKGLTLSISGWARKVNLSPRCIWKRYYYKWPVDELLGFKKHDYSREGNKNSNWKGGISL